MTPLPRDAGFVEVADRVWVARHTPWDVNAVLVGGSRGLVLVDTLWSEATGRRLLEQVSALGLGLDLVAVVDTHHHFDHVLGNAAVDVPIYAHEAAAAAIPAHVAEIQQQCTDDPEQHHRDEILESRVVVPTQTFSSVAVVDLGDRAIELVHPGRGHTAGDIVARVGDVLLAGDLVEESTERFGVPGYGDDCYPMSWPETLDLVLQLTGPDTVVIPGHGNPVNKEYVEAQRDAIGVVAETIRGLAARGVPVAEALTAADWPYPREELGDAVRRGYAELPHAARSLPLA